MILKGNSSVNTDFKISKYNECLYSAVGKVVTVLVSLPRLFDTMVVDVGSVIFNERLARCAHVAQVS